MDSRLLYPVPEVCEMTALGPTTVRDLIRRGELESVRVGKSLRVPADSLHAFIAKLREKAQAEDPHCSGRRAPGPLESAP